MHAFSVLDSYARRVSTCTLRGISLLRSSQLILLECTDRFYTHHRIERSRVSRVKNCRGSRVEGKTFKFDVGVHNYLINRDLSTRQRPNKHEARPTVDILLSTLDPRQKPALQNIQFYAASRAIGSLRNDDADGNDDATKQEV